jgi:hypothetical protein
MERAVLFLSVLFIACNSETPASDKSITQDKLITEGHRSGLIKLYTDKGNLYISCFQGRFNNKMTIRKLITTVR